MKTFIKVTEIWTPEKDRTQLELNTGLYGNLDEFKSASEHQHFKFAEGLPGMAWEKQHPIVLTEFKDSYFKRTEVAIKSGLTCGIAIPVFAGDFLMAVIVFLCGDDEAHAGAIEFWSNDPDKPNELGVIEGYYGTLDYFEFTSRKTKIMKGSDLAGMVWERGMPVLLDDLGESTSFIRGRDAKTAGITTGLAIPISQQGRQVNIMSFLSAMATPIAKQIEIWIPDQQGRSLLFSDGYTLNNAELKDLYANTNIAKNEFSMGKVWLTGVPIITESLVDEHVKPNDDLSSMLVMPVLQAGKILAIVNFIF